jgi:uncharacterized circularly permuted ATP-grasp superfamily protein
MAPVERVEGADDDALVPRPVDLRVFSVAGPSGTRVLPCPLTRVAPSPATRPTGAAIKPTWLLT